MPRFFLSCLAVAIYLSSTAEVAAQGVDRVDTKVALAQVVTRVDPIVPPDAAKARIGGAVIADVTIGVNGRVTSIAILDGAPALHAAAQSALRQWTFKPFLRNGKPRAVITVLEVNFPDPVRDDANRTRETYRAALYECERQLEIDPGGAVPLCKAAVVASEKLPSYRIPAGGIIVETEMAARAYRLVRSGRLQEAVVVVKEMAAKRSAAVGGDDRVLAEDLVTLALLQQRLGANAEAEQNFSRADAMYAALANRTPQDMQSIGPIMRRALEYHAAFRRSTGNEAGAVELEGKVAAIVIAPRPASPSPRDFVRTTRRLGAVTIVESSEARISDTDVAAVLAVLGPKSVWWIETLNSYEPKKAEPSLMVHACTQPTVTTRTLRRGRCTPLVKGATSGPRQSGGWQGTGDGFEFAQVAVGAGEPASQPPVRLDILVDGTPFADDTIVRLVSLVRRKAVASPTSRLRSDIQPWPIERIVVIKDEVAVSLRSVDGKGMQTIRLRPTGDGWDVVEMR